MTVTIRFGPANELTREFARNTTVSTLLGDRGIQSALGFGSNVQAVIDGEVQNPASPLADGDVVLIETKANAKA